jgi:hypothetical protein
MINVVIRAPSIHKKWCRVSPRGGRGLLRELAGRPRLRRTAGASWGFAGGKIDVFRAVALPDLGHALLAYAVLVGNVLQALALEDGLDDGEVTSKLSVCWNMLRVYFHCTHLFHVHAAGTCLHTTRGADSEAGTRLVRFWRLPSFQDSRTGNIRSASKSVNGGQWKFPVRL